ncbi:MAG TPA: LLM class F420-dependent oxidoreductase [Candidatus Limnocylindrales bacterium]
MKLGLQISSFDFPGGPAVIAPTLARIVRVADDVGFDSIWVMDHFFQIRGVGAVTDPMLEGWTTLGYMAALSSRARLGLMVGGVHYRQPGLWIKAATTLDVLSGGRAWLGIGAAWNEDESRALGFPFPPLAERFEMLEDTLRMAHAMWTGERGTEGAFEGTHVRAERLLNSPPPLTRPHPPILVGGGGERKTLRLVAQYADACNVFGGPEIVHRKYEILRAHCEAVGRPYDEIERTNLQDVDMAPSRAGDPRHRRASRSESSPDRLVERFGELADAGVQHVILSPRTIDPARLEAIGGAIVPQLRGL